MGVPGSRVDRMDSMREGSSGRGSEGAEEEPSKEGSCWAAAACEEEAEKDLEGGCMRFRRDVERVCKGCRFGRGLEDKS
jgi:hypothetical protein